MSPTGARRNAILVPSGEYRTLPKSPSRVWSGGIVCSARAFDPSAFMTHQLVAREALWLEEHLTPIGRPEAGLDYAFSRSRVGGLDPSVSMR